MKVIRAVFNLFKAMPATVMNALILARPGDSFRIAMVNRIRGKIGNTVLTKPIKSNYFMNKLNKVSAAMVSS